LLINRVRVELFLLLFLPVVAFAGAQREDDMSVAVRTALAAAVAGDRTPPEPLFDSPAHRAAWIGQMADRLPRRWKPDFQQRIEFLKTVRYEAQRAGLEPELVLGLIEVESYFRRYAISSAGARGYMQVMPFWTRVIGDGEPASLFDMRTNIRMGCLILRHYLDMEKGNLFLALGRYNGSRGRSEYPVAVERAWKKWMFKKIN
jgi:soluble lytic murein transglycosylase-like protein